MLLADLLQLVRGTPARRGSTREHNLDFSPPSPVRLGNLREMDVLGRLNSWYFSDPPSCGDFPAGFRFIAESDWGNLASHQVTIRKRFRV